MAVRLSSFPPIATSTAPYVYCTTLARFVNAPSRSTDLAFAVTLSSAFRACTHPRCKEAPKLATNLSAHLGSAIRPKPVLLMLRAQQLRLRLNHARIA
jgi:hypothetical protein